MTFIAFSLANILAVKKLKEFFCLFEIKDFRFKSLKVQLSRLKNRKRDPKLAVIFGKKVPKN